MRREAAWLGRRLGEIAIRDLSPMLSVGSGTKAFRAAFQPWIESDVYGPLGERGVTVLHHEMFAAPGVDVVGDLGDPDVRDHLRQLGVRSVMCLNVFEHVLDREGLADALVGCLPRGGIAVVTVPRRFPYHADPIDTLFRPTAEELGRLFRGIELVDTGTVKCESLLSHWLSKPGKLKAVRKAFNGLTRTRSSSNEGPSSESRSDDREFAGPSLRSTLSMLLGSTEVTYAVLRRP